MKKSNRGKATGSVTSVPRIALSNQRKAVIALLIMDVVADARKSENTTRVQEAAGDIHRFLNENLVPLLHDARHTMVMMLWMMTIEARKHVGKGKSRKKILCGNSNTLRKIYASVWDGFMMQFHTGAITLEELRKTIDGYLAYDPKVAVGILEPLTDIPIVHSEFDEFILLVMEQALGDKFGLTTHITRLRERPNGAGVESPLD